jgi:hypothetical protein
MKRIVLALIASLALIALMPIPAAASADLIVRSEISDEVLEPGDSANLILNIKNVGILNKARNVTISIEGNECVTPLKNSFNVGSIPRMESVQVAIPITVSESAKGGDYSLKAEIHYSTLIPPSRENKEVYIPVKITTFSFLDITEVDYGSAPLQPGDEFSLSITIKNQGIGTARNIRVVLAYEVTETSGILPEGLLEGILPGLLPEGLLPKELFGPERTLQLVEIPFMPLVDFIATVDSLPPGEETKVEFRLKAGMSAEPKTYAIPMLIFYQNNNGEEQPEVKDVVGIELKARPILGIAGITLDPDRVHEGEDYTLTIHIENIGAGKARSVRVILNDDIEILGTISPEDVETAIFYLTGTKAGKHSLPLAIGFSDEDGEPIEVMENIDLDVYPAGGVNVYYIVIPLVIIGVIILAVFLWRRRRGRAM